MGKYVDFDQSAYASAVKREIMDEIQSVKAHVLTSLQTSFSTLEFRKVDAKYKAAMQSSITATIQQRTNSFIASFGSGGATNKQNQAFRALYYEYGTGNKAEPPNGLSESINPAKLWGAWNMARKGRDIYQRPRGVWYDLGGNPHRSRIKGEPQMLPNRAGSFGEEITARHWFSEALNKSLSMLDGAIRRAVKKVPLSAYIVIRSIHKRM